MSGRDTENLKNVELSTTSCKTGNFCSGLRSCLSKNISWCNFYWNRKNLFEDNRYCTYRIPWEKIFYLWQIYFLWIIQLQPIFRFSNGYGLTSLLTGKNFKLLIYSIVTVYHVLLQRSMYEVDFCRYFFHRRFVDNHEDKSCCILHYQIQCRCIENQRQSPGSQKKEQMQCNWKNKVIQCLLLWDVENQQLKRIRYMSVQKSDPFTFFVQKKIWSHKGNDL